MTYDFILAYYYNTECGKFSVSFSVKINQNFSLNGSIQKKEDNRKLQCHQPLCRFSFFFLLQPQMIKQVTETERMSRKNEYKAAHIYLTDIC